MHEFHDAVGDDEELDVDGLGPHRVVPGCSTRKMMVCQVGPTSHY
jgi:hypothetical protein